MNVESKMTYVVKRVLGDNYSVIILNDHEYQILIQGDIAIYSTMTKNIMNHWKEIIADGISVIIKEKLKAALNEI